jgi:hypothetical protein
VAVLVNGREGGFHHHWKWKECPKQTQRGHVWSQVFEEDREQHDRNQDVKDINTALLVYNLPCTGVWSYIYIYILLNFLLTTYLV